MQINTNTLADRTQITHNAWLESMPKEKVSDQQDKSVNDLAAAYGVEISDAGRYMQSVQKQELPLTPSGDIEMGDTSHIKTSSDGQIEFVLTDDNWAEVASLARNMDDIETGIASAIQDPKYCWDPINATALAQALNAYGHKQHDSIIKGTDTYLNGIQARLDMVDKKHQSPMINEIRSMVNSVQHGQDIDWKDEEFVDKINQTMGPKLDLKDAKAINQVKKGLFGQSVAVYSYMKEMNRQAQELAIVQKMLGTSDESSKNQAAGDIQKKSSLADGLEAYHRDYGIVHLFEDDLLEKPTRPITYGERADGAIVERPNEETHNSALGYDWGHIMKEYLKEHPELADIIR